MHNKSREVLLQKFHLTKPKEKDRNLFFVHVVVCFVLDMRTLKLHFKPSFWQLKQTPIIWYIKQKKKILQQLSLFSVKNYMYRYKRCFKNYCQFFYVGLIKLFLGDVVGPSLLTDSHVCLVAVRVLWLGEGCVAVFRIGLVRVLVHVADLITAERVWLWLLCVFICVDMLGYTTKYTTSVTTK